MTAPIMMMMIPTGTKTGTGHRNRTPAHRPEHRHEHRNNRHDDRNTGTTGTTGTATGTNRHACKDLFYLSGLYIFVIPKPTKI